MGLIGQDENEMGTTRRTGGRISLGTTGGNDFCTLEDENNDGVDLYHA